MAVHTVSPRINVHALISENCMLWGCFEMILCSNIKMHAFFSKSKCTLIFSDFVAHYDTLNNSVISLCL